MLAASERGIWFLLDGILSREYALASSISTFLLKHSTINHQPSVLVSLYLHAWYTVSALARGPQPLDFSLLTS